MPLNNDQWDALPALFDGMAEIAQAISPELGSIASTTPREILRTLDGAQQIRTGKWSIAYGGVLSDNRVLEIVGEWIGEESRWEPLRIGERPSYWARPQARRTDDLRLLWLTGRGAQLGVVHLGPQSEEYRWLRVPSWVTDVDEGDPVETPRAGLPGIVSQLPLMNGVTKS